MEIEKTFIVFISSLESFGDDPVGHVKMHKLKNGSYFFEKHNGVISHVSLERAKKLIGEI